MGLTTFIIEAILITLLVITIIQQPLVSFEFGKAYLKSTYVLGSWAYKEVKSFMLTIKEGNKNVPIDLVSTNLTKVNSTR